MDFTIDAMQPEDWPAVRAVHVEGLSTGNASFETQPPGWDDWDRSHHAHSRLVARSEGQPIAWAALAPVSKRRCYAGVAEVSLYVAAAWRGRGVGKAVLRTLIESSERHGIWSLYGACFPENEASVRLQLSCGFRIVGRRERIACLNGVWRDTVLTERRSRVVGVEPFQSSGETS